MSVITRTQCPQCTDSGRDNLVHYNDGGKHCFACGYHEGTKDSSNMEHTEVKKASGLVNGYYDDIPNRGLSKKTCEFFKYQLGKFNGSVCHIANYCDDMGIVTSQKLRLPGKKMPQLGDAGNKTLYGKWLWKPTTKLPIVITEGELDALSVAQSFNLKYPVVSLPDGAQSAERFIRKELEWLCQFRDVVLCFDQDEAGREAIKSVIDILPIGKVRVVKMPLKDANEMLVAGNSTQLRECIWNAAEIRPEAIVTAQEALKEALIKPEPGLSWPWQTLTRITYGIQPNSIYTLGAGSGIGKTELLKDLALHLSIKHGEKVGAIFLESTPAQILLRLAGGVLGRRIHVPGDEWDEEEVKGAMSRFNDKVYFYDPRKGYNVASIFSKIRYLAKGLGVKYIILDHLTALAAEMTDERKQLDDVMSKLGALVHELGITIFLVSHLSKPNMGKSYEEGRRVTASAFRGSQSIQYWSSFMLGLERDKLNDNPEERQITTVRILKDRFTGEADGESFKLKYCRLTGLLSEMKPQDTDNLFKEII